MNTFNNLRKKGYRITEQRKKLLDQLYSHPQTVDELFVNLKKNNVAIDLASVYRILQLFSRYHIVRQVDFNDGKKRFELSDSKKHHHHIVCKNCGTVEDVVLANEEKIIKKLMQGSKFRIDRHSLEFFGVCENCQ